jgi:hypothetical protein
MSLYAAFGLAQHVANYVALAAGAVVVISGYLWGKRSRIVWVSAALVVFLSALGVLCHLLSRPLDKQGGVVFWMDFALVCSPMFGFSLMFMYAMLKASSASPTSKPQPKSHADHLTPMKSVNG